MGCVRKSALSGVAAVAIQASVLLATLFAGDSDSTPPPCEAYSRSDLVFVGTITESLAVQDGRVMRARMHVDRIYKGVSTSELIIVPEVYCLSPELLVDRQYLIYTWGSGEEVVSAGCWRSGLVKFADEDLSYLDGLGIADPAARVFGHVSLSAPDFARDHRAPRALVILHGVEDGLITFTDSKGQYSFDGLKPGKYTVSASQFGFRMYYDIPKVAVESRGCAVIDPVLSKDWPATIAGRLIRPDNTPASPDSDITVTLIPVGDVPEQTERTFVYTNERGEYSFGSVAPGRYKVAIHPGGFPEPQSPYTPIYWPAASTEDAASVIEIHNEAVSRSYDFLLPPVVKKVEIDGTVVLPGGKAVQGAEIDIVKLPEEQICGSAISDESGHFTLTAMDGVEYGITATKTGDTPLASQIAHFSVGKTPLPLPLLLDEVH
jgi:hypothetical protein